MANGTAKLEAHELSISKVFSSDFDFRIPEYQRPYSWRAEHALQLLDDLGEALDRGEDEPYFLGSVVLVKQPDSAHAEVIDGQQRITTLTILLALLRDSSQPELASELRVMLQEPGSAMKGLQPKPRLQLRERDAEFFQKYVQEMSSTDNLIGVKESHIETDSARAVVANAAAMRGALDSADWSPERRFRLVQLLGQRTFLVVVSTPDLDSAYRIFSVMNARGLNLSPADIFKSQVIGSLPEDETKKYADRWEDAEASLGHDDFAELFQNIRMVFAKERPRKNILREFPEQVLNSYIRSGAEKKFVDEVVTPYAKAFREIRDYSFVAPSGADQVNAWFKRLNSINNSDWRPPALWALKNHWDDAVFLDEFLRLLERLAASMMIRRVYATPRVTKYAELLKDLDAGHGLKAPSFDLSDDDKKRTISALNGEVYLNTQGRRYILLRLDEALSNSPGVKYDYKIITVEHVLPQNPKQKSIWHKTFTDSDRSFWTHRLSNLVLLNRAKNSEAQNFDYDVKKAKYFTGKSGVSAFALTSQVLSTEKWNPKILESRQKSLVETLTREWNLS